MTGYSLSPGPSDPPSPGPVDWLSAVAPVMMATASSIVWLRSPEPPTAVFSSQNLITVGAVRALRAGRVQHGTALVGFDAATILFRRIEGDTSPVQTHIVPVSLIPRGSGEIPVPAG